MGDEAVPGLDVERLLSVGKLLGPAGVRVAVSGLGEALDAAFAKPGAERGEAHALASQAEMVGLMALGAACRAVEVEARAGRPLATSLTAAREARDAAAAAIAEFLAHENIMVAATAASERLRTPSRLNSACR